MAAQQTNRAAPTPPHNSQLIFRGAVEGFTNPAAAATGALDEAARGSGAPHFKQFALAAGLTVPQLVQVTSFGPRFAAKSAPEARRLASTRSPPHCLQTLA